VTADAEYCLVVTGPDQAGIVAGISGLITRLGGNIVSLDQFSDNPHGGAFFQRVVFVIGRSAELRAELEQALDLVAGGQRLSWTLTDQSVAKRMIVLASRSDHCLLDLLWRQRRGELPVTIPMVISNHRDAEVDVRSFGVPFVHVPSAGPDKTAAEAELLRLITGNADFVVLARYMQILSSDFLERVGVPLINIHHSFLPAFVGASPYQRAKERGVKLIGATAHYVTDELDEGPIIEQDVARASHADTVADLQRRGADVERQVLSRAVLWHAQDRVVRHGRHTIVFA